MNEQGLPRAMTAEEVAREIGVSKRWVVQHHADLPFARRLSRKTIVYDRAGFEKWWATTRSTTPYQEGPAR